MESRFMLSVVRFWNQLSDTDKLLIGTIFVAIYPQLKEGIIQVGRTLRSLLLWTYRQTIGFSVEAFLTWWYVKRLLGRPMKFIRITPWIDMMQRWGYYRETGIYRQPWQPLVQPKAGDGWEEILQSKKKIK